MSINLPNAAATIFMAEVKQIFQNEGGVLRPAVRTRSAGNAKTVQFNLMGKTQTQERASIQTPIPVSNVAHTQPTATVKNYTVAEMTDIFADAQTPIDERMELAQSFASALRRREDQIILDALAAATAGTTVANNVSGAVADLTLDSLRATAKYMDALGIPDTDRHMVIHPNGLHNLLEDSQVSSSDFAVVKALVQGDLDSYYGFKFHKIGNRDEGGLAIDGSNDRTNFAFHRMAVGYAVNLEPRISVDWDAEYQAWRVTGILSAGATVIDESGLVDIITREA